MAKKGTAEEQMFDLEGAVNSDNPLEELGELDFGDDLGEKPDEAPEPDEPEEEEEPGEDEDDSGEEGEPDEEEPETPEDPEPVEEPEQDEESDEKPAEEPAPRDDKGRFSKEPAIPKSRFDQRTAQLRAAERELEQMREKLQQVESDKQKAEREANTLSDEQLQQKMLDANQALIDGDTEKASKLQAEVFGAIRQGQASVDAEASGQTVDPNKIAADVRDQMEFEQTLSRVTQEYPFFDEKSEQFDEALSEEAVNFQRMYYQQGYTRAEATEKAASAVAKIYGVAPANAETAQEPQTSKKASMAKKAQTAATRKKVQAAKKAPPSMGGNPGANDDSADSVDIESITVEDWAALPDSVRARLLGDQI